MSEPQRTCSVLRAASGAGPGAAMAVRALHVLDMSLELGPARQAELARDHQLAVGKPSLRQRLGGIRVPRLHARGGGAIARLEGAAKLLGAGSLLVEIEAETGVQRVRLVAHRTIPFQGSASAIRQKREADLLI